MIAIWIGSYSYSQGSTWYEHYKVVGGGYLLLWHGSHTTDINTTDHDIRSRGWYFHHYVGHIAFETALKQAGFDPVYGFHRSCGRVWESL